MMKKNFFTIFLCFVFSSGYADLCMKTFEQDTADADVIFTGTVINIDHGAFWHRDRPSKIVTFKIHTSFKGLNSYRGFISIFEEYLGCCSPDFIFDSAYIVYAYSEDKYSWFHWTNDCSWTSLLSKTQNLNKVFGNVTTHENNDQAIKRLDKKRSGKDSVDNMNKKLLSENNTLKKNNRVQLWIIYGFIVLTICLILLKSKRLLSI